MLINQAVINQVRAVFMVASSYPDKGGYMDLPRFFTRIIHANAYGPATRPIVKRWIAPVRRTLFGVRFQWPWIRIALVSIALLLTIGPSINWVLAACLVAGYIGWHTLTDLFGVINSQSERVCLIRNWGVVTTVTLLVLGFHSPVAPIWVLYFVPVLAAGAELGRWPAMVLIFSAAGAAFYSNMPQPMPAVTSPDYGPAWSQAALSGGLLRSTMLVYAGLTSYIVARSLAYLEGTNRELTEFLPKISRTTWTKAGHATVEFVEQLFRPNRQDTNSGFLEKLLLRKHDDVASSKIIVNLLTVEADQLVMTASSHPRQQLPESNGFPRQHGVTGWVAARGEYCFLQDIALDDQKRFMVDPDFPQIKAEIAVPVVSSANRVVAVLDVEALETNAFHIEDLETLRLVCAGLAEAYEQDRLLSISQSLAGMTRELANRAITPLELPSLLEDIGAPLLDILGAQLMCFYPRGLRGEIYGPITASTRSRRERVEAPAGMRADRLITRLIDGSRVRFFEDAQQAPELAESSNAQDEGKWSISLVSKTIVSSVAIPLAAGLERFGLMVVHYQQRQTFTPELENLIEAVSPVSVIAVQRYLNEAARESDRRRRFVDELHDAISFDLLLVDVALSQLATRPARSPEWDVAFVAARMSVNAAHGTVSNLRGARDKPTLQGLIDQAAYHANQIRSVQGIDVSVTQTPATDWSRAVDPKVEKEIRYAMTEALTNAMRHSGAGRIEVAFALTGEMLEAQITDNGCGFDPQAVKPGSGLASLRARIEEHVQGEYALITAPGQGTSIRMRVRLPIISEEEIWTS